MFKKFSFLIILLLGVQFVVLAEGDGYGENPGGAGGDTIVVDNPNDFKSYAGSSNPYVILVKGIIDVGSEVRVTSYKTISGIDSASTVIGNISIKGGTHDVVVKNLNITNPQEDGITIREAKYIYVTNCTVYDCADGCIDITVESDFVTVSHCRFYYENVTFHKFVNLIGASDDNVTDRGKLHVTMHHNWWDRNCDCRMPRVRYGRVHMYNNYFSCANNQYCTSARVEAEVFSENNYYNGVNDPFNVEDGGKAKSVGNKYANCNGSIYAGNDEVFYPTYSYSIEGVIDAKENVLLSAGNTNTNPVTTNPKRETLILWANPETILFGTPLSENQLSAKAEGNTSTPIYAPALGTKLPEGNQTITVTFPEDDNYKTASKTVNIKVVYEYFSLSVNITEGVDPGLITISPEGVLENGFYIFPKATEVTLTASSNTLSTFDHWSDGDTNPTKTLTINEDTEITAIYNQKNYIVGWDFYAEGNRDRVADYYSSDENNSSTLVLYDEKGTSTTWRLISATNSSKWFDKYAALVGKSKANVGSYYFQINFNAANFKNLSVSASMLGTLTYYQNQNVEYSTNGNDFKKIGEFKFEQDSTWYSGSFKLPDDANACKTVAVRFKADKSSALTQNGIIGTSITDIYVYADNSSTNAIYDQHKKIDKQVVEKQFYTIDGRRVAMPLPGLNLVLTKYSDGSRIIEKIIIKK